MTDIYKAIDTVASDMVKATLSYARDELIYEANTKLRSTSTDYKQAISAVTMEGPLKGYVQLNGKFPALLENGCNKFDEKIGFSKSPKRTKVVRRVDGKNEPGWYLTIPFRHRTAGRGSLPPKILKAAKNLKYGQYLEESLVRDLGYSPQRSNTGYKWKNSKYDYLVRKTKTYKSGAKRSQYLTFRRVSDKSDPKSWFHPGLKGIKAFPKVSKKAEKFSYDYLEANLWYRCWTCL